MAGNHKTLACADKDEPPRVWYFAITSVLNERAPGRVGSRRLNLAEQVDTLKRFTFADEIMALSADRGSLWLRRRAQ